MARKSLTWQLLSVLLLGLVLVAAVSQVAVHAEDTSEDDADDVADAAEEATGGSQVVPTGDESEEEQQEPELEPLEGVTTIAHFPKHAAGKTPTINAGDTTELLLGIVNSGDTPLTVIGTSGVIYVVMDGIYPVQNISVNTFNVSVPPKVQASFPFSFTPDKRLQPRSFGLAAKVVYEAEGSLHSSIFFNSTIEIIEPRGVVSGETVFLVMLAIGVLTLAGMWVYGQIEKASKKSRKGKKVETGTKGEDDVSANEWLQGTFFDQKNSSSKSQPTKSRKKRIA